MPLFDDWVSENKVPVGSWIAAGIDVLKTRGAGF